MPGPCCCICIVGNRRGAAHLHDLRASGWEEQPEWRCGWGVGALGGEPRARAALSRTAAMAKTARLCIPRGSTARVRAGGCVAAPWQSGTTIVCAQGCPRLRTERRSGEEGRRGGLPGGGWRDGRGGVGGGRPAIVRLCRRRHCQTAGDFVAQGPLPTRPRGGTRRLGRRRGRVARLGAIIAVTVAQLAGQGLPVGDEHGVSPM